MNKPFTRECYEHVSDDNYRPLPREFVLFVQEDDGSWTQTNRGQREDLEMLAPAGRKYLIAEVFTTRESKA